MEILLKLIIFLPLMSGIVNGVFCKKFSNNLASKIACVPIISTVIYAALIFVHVGIEKNILHIIVASWIKFDSLNIDWAIYVDPLTSIMFLLVTIVSAIVHLYSLGYMANDKNLPKFLSYLSLFTFFMLALVSADNFIQLFFGWEGVGLCSYLLIGYYYKKESANKAAIKAFIVNRICDVAFIIGIVMIILYTGSVDFENVFALSQNLSKMTLEILNIQFVILDIICLMLFLGCMGKSAQIGMHIWLPDAMEGPTPVSALIHAATMVTAGVFLLARCSFMFEYSPAILQFITIIGAVTCLFAALIAITQNDIKKIIAYSTCSQLGYMFFACGVSAYQAGIFHLITHGFFKALLFLSAGSVIHACGEQNLFKMGGLRAKMPITYANFWIGSLAIIGIFPFAGFYSKDMILESAYTGGGVSKFAFIFGIIAALLTAIYSLKIIILAFHGKTNLKADIFKQVHESPHIMNLPMLLLVAGALFSGMIGFYILNIASPYGFFSGSIFNLYTASGEKHLTLIIEILPLIIGMLGMIVGTYIYTKKLSDVMLYEIIAKKIRFIYCLIKNKFFIDEIFNKLFILPTRILSNLTNIIDAKIIDSISSNAVILVTRSVSWCVCRIQTGYIFNYAFYIIFAIVSCLTFFVANHLYIWGI